MLYQTKRKTGGFVGVVFLAIALIGIVIAAISAMSRSSASGTASESMRVNASVMLKQTSDFKIGFDRMVVSGIPSASITFDDTLETGLFDPTPGAQYSVRHRPPSGLILLAYDSYYSSQTVTLPGIGGAGADYLVTAVVKDLSSCQTINKILYSDLTTATPATSSGPTADWIGGTPVDDSGVIAVNYVGRPEGCVQSSSGEYIYYKALAEQ